MSDLELAGLALLALLCVLGLFLLASWVEDRARRKDREDRER